MPRQGALSGVSAALNYTDLRVDLTAVDPHGASTSTHVLFQVAPPGAIPTAPSFTDTAGVQGFVVNEPIAEPGPAGGERRRHHRQQQRRYAVLLHLRG